jgi:hypothetical protein
MRTFKIFYSAVIIIKTAGARVTNEPIIVDIDLIRSMRQMGLYDEAAALVKAHQDSIHNNIKEGKRLNYNAKMKERYFLMKKHKKCVACPGTTEGSDTNRCPACNEKRRVKSSLQNTTVVPQIRDIS